jgi:hypothetical protein
MNMRGAGDYGRGKAAELRAWCHAAIERHRDDGTIPTTGRFIFYEAVMAGVTPKHATGVRRADQAITDALTWLRERGLVRWHEIADRTRHVTDKRGYPSIAEGVEAILKHIPIDPWDGEPPLVVVESESLAGLYDSLVTDYRSVLVPVRGQASSGLLFNDVAPFIEAGSFNVFYVGDHDKSGYDIEASARDRLQRFAGQSLKWRRVALTGDQVEQYGLPLIERVDRRERDGRAYLVCETEAMPQATLTRLVTEALHELLPGSLDGVHERERIEREAFLDRLRRG